MPCTRSNAISNKSWRKSRQSGNKCLPTPIDCANSRKAASLSCKPKSLRSKKPDTGAKGTVVLHRECCGCDLSEIVGANEILDRTDVMRQFFGERESLTHQTGDTLPQGIVEPLDVIGFACFLGDGLVPLRRNHAGVGVISIRMEGGLFTVDHRNLGPQRFGTVTTAIAHMKRNDLVRGRVHRDPHPLLVDLLLHETPQFIGLSFEPAPDDIRRTSWEPHMQILRTGGEALHHEVQQPSEANAHSTTDPTQRDALTQQAFHHDALPLRNMTIVGHSDKLPRTRTTLMVLFVMPAMAIFLILGGSTRGARLSHDHGCW